MGESIGAAHVGFMAEVQEEIQVRGGRALVKVETSSLKGGAGLRYWRVLV